MGLRTKNKKKTKNSTRAFDIIHIHRSKTRWWGTNLCSIKNLVILRSDYLLFSLEMHLVLPTHQCLWTWHVEIAKGNISKREDGKRTTLNIHLKSFVLGSTGSVKAAHYTRRNVLGCSKVLFVPHAKWVENAKWTKYWPRRTHAKFHNVCVCVCVRAQKNEFQNIRHLSSFCLSSLSFACHTLLVQLREISRR